MGRYLDPRSSGRERDRGREEEEREEREEREEEGEMSSTRPAAMVHGPRWSTLEHSTRPRAAEDLGGGKGLTPLSEMCSESSDVHLSLE